MVLLVMDGERVRSLREKKGWSRRRLAAVSGVSAKTLENAELGKTHALPATARKVGAALEVDPRSLGAVARRA